MMITVKKYRNRRLYDTDESRYMTVDELAKLRQEMEELEAATRGSATPEE